MSDLFSYFLISINNYEKNTAFSFPLSYAWCRCCCRFPLLFLARFLQTYRPRVGSRVTAGVSRKLRIRFFIKYLFNFIISISRVDVSLFDQQAAGPMLKLRHIGRLRAQGRTSTTTTAARPTPSPPPPTTTTKKKNEIQSRCYHHRRQNNNIVI